LSTFDLARAAKADFVMRCWSDSNLAEVKEIFNSQVTQKKGLETSLPIATVARRSPARLLRFYGNLWRFEEDFAFFFFFERPRKFSQNRVDLDLRHTLNFGLVDFFLRLLLLREMIWAVIRGVLDTFLGFGLKIFGELFERNF
jgi:hypothetical protein